jgi:mRNA interferase HigB
MFILINRPNRWTIVPFWDYHCSMRVIALSTLKAFWEDNPEYTDAKDPTLAWYRHTLRADWANPTEVKQDFGNASILKDGRVVFNIAGNKYRLVVWINYAYRVVYVRFIGTHKQYDEIDAQTM